MLWRLVSGGLLASRGALFPALQAIGLDAAATRRAWVGFGIGKWQISRLVAVWGLQLMQMEFAITIMSAAINVVQ